MRKIFLILMIALIGVVNSVQADERKIYSKDNIRKVKNIWLDDQGVPVTGRLVSYYQNGRIKEDFNLVRGKTEGKQYIYFVKGGIFVEAMFKNNERDGLTKYYYLSGGTLSKINFSKGKLIDGYCINEYGEKIEFNDEQKRTFVRKGTLPCKFM